MIETLAAATTGPAVSARKKAGDKLTDKLSDAISDRLFALASRTPSVRDP